MPCRFCRMPTLRPQNCLCPKCAASTVRDPALATRLMAAAQAWMKTEGMAFKQPRIPLFLVPSFPGDGQEASLSDGETLGRTHVRAMGLRGIWERVDVERIEIRIGLPEMLFESTLVHELSHALLADRGVLGLKQVEEEGFCQLVEHRWASRLPSPTARLLRLQIEHRSDAVYGAGFRIMHARMVRAGGFRPLLDQLTARAPTKSPRASPEADR